MKKFKEFINESDVPTNVSGAVVSTSEPVVSKSSSYKYKMKNKKQADGNEKTK